MSEDSTLQAEVFCPHCKEAVHLDFLRPIPKQPHIIVSPKSGRSIYNARPEPYVPLTPELYPCCGGRERHTNECAI